MTARFLGIDGGGSKTEFVCIDAAGTVLARSLQGTTYHPQVGLDGVRAALAAGIASICGQLAIGPDALAHVFFGLPAYGEDRAVDPLLREECGRILGHDRYDCGNDMICGWAGSFGCGDGINLVAGTGSIGYGQRGGRHARAGGWGEVFGDEGSAYWIAVEGLRLFSKMSDGRLPPGPLHAMLKQQLELDDDLDLCARILGPQGMARDEVAGLAQIVSRAAAAGDTEAVAILQTAGEQLAAIAIALRAALRFAPGELAPLSYSGSILTLVPTVGRALRRTLEAAGGFTITWPAHPPGIGAALYAAHLARDHASDANLNSAAGS